MKTRSFNLTTEPWLKVISLADNQEKTVSLIELFENAQSYRELSGEMRSQDLAILRFLLAILTTVYSRFDPKGEPYPWLKLDKDSLKDIEKVDEDDQLIRRQISKDLLNTWKQLYGQNGEGHFTKIVTTYLRRYKQRFDLFGESPFYQVGERDYNRLVPTNKQISGSEGPGKVAIKQMNRQISESGNKPSLFSPKTPEFKNQLKLDELTRWLISYENYSGVTDKTKINMSAKYSVSSGWLYKLNPVYATGDNLFQTLMLNLILINQNRTNRPYTPQKPVWEYSVAQYISKREKMLQPDNLAELYTVWSRMLHINWSKNGDPTIFSAGLPMFDSAAAFIEPMTTWRVRKEDGKHVPAEKRLSTMGTAMWRNFGQYVPLETDNHESEKAKPGIVKWLKQLKEADGIPQKTRLTLASADLIRDDNAASQMPAAEIFDDMQIDADVLFDEDPSAAQKWPDRIEDMIVLTQKIGSDYWRFAANIGRLRNVDDRSFANKMIAEFYDGLNVPFKNWLRSLNNIDDRDTQSNDWKKKLKDYVQEVADEVIQSSSPRDMTGFVDVNGVIDKNKGLVNIFTINNQFRTQVFRDMG